MLRRGLRQFATLVRVRKRQEEQRAERLAAAHRLRRRAQAERDHLEAERRRMFERAGQAAQGRMSAAEVRRYYQYERHLARLADEKDAEIMRLRQTEAERRAELEEAMKKRRMVERLHERRTESVLREVQRQEQRMSDESGTTRAAAQSKEGPKG